MDFPPSIGSPEGPSGVRLGLEDEICGRGVDKGLSMVVANGGGEAGL